MPSHQIAEDTLFYAETKGLNSVVLIHGAASSHLCWPPGLRRIPGYRVLALDLPGHGRSSGEGRQRVEEYADSIHALLDALKIEKAIFVGHSMGSAIAQMIGLTLPDRTAGLILIGTGAQLKVSDFILDNALENPQPVIEFINKWAWSPTAPEQYKLMDKQVLSSVPAKILYGDYLACSRFDLQDRIHEINAPTLVISGSLDKMTPPALAQFLAEQIPNAKLETIEGGSHWMMLEQSEKVTEVVRYWLENR